MSTTEMNHETTQALAPAPAAKVPVKMGIAPTTLDEGWRLAQMMAKSELVPKNFRNKPEDVLVAIQMGVEIGLPPMQSLQSIAVINGRPSVWGDGFLALIMASPQYADHDEYYEVDGQRRDGVTAEDLKKETTTAVCTFLRHGKKTPTTRRFSVAQAKKASLLGKEGPWQSYPDRMLAMRARGFAGRDAFPDVLRGIRTAEEAADTPPDVDIVVSMPPPSEVKRLSETKPAAPAAPSTPPAESVVVGPARVKDVEVLVGTFFAVLDNGERIQVPNDGDAVELEKFKGTDHAVRLTCVKTADGLTLKSFAIAD